MGVLSPMRAMIGIFEEIARRADEELYDEEGIKTELMNIYRQLEAGSLTEEEFGRREAELVERLEAVEEHNSGRGARGSR